MPNREIQTRVSITFTDQEWNELCNLYNQLDIFMNVEHSNPEVSEQELTMLIANLQASLDALLVDNEKTE